MILRIFSDLKHFKEVDFRSGLSILLAEKSAEATDKHTRNRAGKSSLLDIVHFLLGSNCAKESIFRNSELLDSHFGMELELAGEIVEVQRSGSKPSQIKVSGDTRQWPVPPIEKDGSSYISNDNWKLVLGKLMFGIDEFEGPWAPSFRSLISYFVRRDREGGMDQPMLNGRLQRPVDQQVNISFLIGLDWTIPREWQQIRDREKSLELLKKGMQDGALGPVVGSASHLKSELIVARAQASKLKKALSTFRVVDQYHDLEREATWLTNLLAQLSDDNIVDKRYIADLEAVAINETPPAPADLEKLYAEAGVVLPEHVRARFDDVAAFHDSIVKNRRAYLASEKAAALRRIAERDSEKLTYDERRSEVMRILNSSGALEHFVQLQAELTKVESAVESLRQRHEMAASLETGDLKLRVERALLLERLRLEYSEQEDVVQEAVLAFREISSQLYEDDNAGTLTITPTDNGPIFDPHIPGEKSKGVNNMRIFCFDMTLVLLSLRRGRSPGFLIHDSHLFDGVDERQVGKALALGASLASKYRFQYVVTLNTDDIPGEVPSDFALSDYALDVRLTDASEDGGLFGLRFE